MAGQGGSDEGQEGEARQGRAAGRQGGGGADGSIETSHRNEILPQVQFQIVFD